MQNEIESDPKAVTFSVIKRCRSQFQLKLATDSISKALISESIRSTEVPVPVLFVYIDATSLTMGSMCGLGRAAEEAASNAVLVPWRVIRIDGDIHVVVRQAGGDPSIQVLQQVGDIPEFTTVNGRLVQQ